MGPSSDVAICRQPSCAASIMGTRLQRARNKARSLTPACSKGRQFAVCDEGTACLPCAARCYLSDRKKDLLTL